MLPVLIGAPDLRCDGGDGVRGGGQGGLALARLLLERPGATMREAAIARRNGS